jgi:hypothetical protein
MELGKLWRNAEVEIFRLGTSVYGGLAPLYSGTSNQLLMVRSIKLAYSIATFMHRNHGDAVEIIVLTIAGYRGVNAEYLLSFAPAEALADYLPGTSIIFGINASLAL